MREIVVQSTILDCRQSVSSPTTAILFVANRVSTNNVPAERSVCGCEVHREGKLGLPGVVAMAIFGRWSRVAMQTHVRELYTGPKGAPIVSYPGRLLLKGPGTRELRRHPSAEKTTMPSVDGTLKRL